MNIIIGWFLSAIVVLIAAYLLPGVHVDNFFAALVFAVVLGILNVLVKPLLLLLTLPLTIVTLGLFTIVINALVVLLASSIVPGFTIDNFGWALLFGVLLSIINLFTAQV